MANGRSGRLRILHRSPHRQRLFQSDLKCAQLADCFFVFLDSVLDDLTHHRARRITVYRVIEDRLDLGERETEILSGENELEAVLVVGLVDPVTIS